MSPFGPFARPVGALDRVVGFHELRALAFLLLGGRHPLVARLADAETDEAAAAEALGMLDRLSALPLPRLLSTWLALH